MDTGEIVLYRPDASTKLEVRIEDESVWLTQAQMASLFETTRNNITLHIGNIFREGELIRDSVCKDSLLTASDGKSYKTKIYNLDVIISVGYRVKSLRGTQFRIWASKVLKDYLMHGYAINQRLVNIEHKLDEHDKKIDFFVRTSLPPIEGVFYNGQIFDAYAFATDLIKSAKKNITLIDNYIDESVLTMFSKRGEKVGATIITQKITKALQLDIDKHNSQYAPIEVKTSDRYHDRFLIIDNIVYHLGASLKDLGKKLFAFSRMGIPAKDLFPI